MQPLQLHPSIVLLASAACSGLSLLSFVLSAILVVAVLQPWADWQLQLLLARLQ
jgi:hypothetical protein